MSLKHLIKRILLEYTEEETVISKKDDKRITFVYKKLNELFDSLIFERVPNNNIFYFKWFNSDGKVMFERNTWGTFWVEPNGCDDCSDNILLYCDSVIITFIIYKYDEKR